MANFNPVLDPQVEDDLDDEGIANSVDGEDVIQCVLTACGMTAGQCDSIMNTEWIVSIDGLHTICLRDIKRMMENLSKLAENCGGACFGAGVAANFNSLVWCVQHMRVQGIAISPAGWTAQTLDDSRNETHDPQKGNPSC
jgi:hypothetical protein